MQKCMRINRNSMMKTKWKFMKLGKNFTMDICLKKMDTNKRSSKRKNFSVLGSLSVILALTISPSMEENLKRNRQKPVKVSMMMIMNYSNQNLICLHCLKKISSSKSINTSLTQKTQSLTLKIRWINTTIVLWWTKLNVIGTNMRIIGVDNALMRVAENKRVSE